MGEEGKLTLRAPLCGSFCMCSGTEFQMVNHPLRGPHSHPSKSPSLGHKRFSIPAVYIWTLNGKRSLWLIWLPIYRSLQIVKQVLCVAAQRGLTARVGTHLICPCFKIRRELHPGLQEGSEDWTKGCNSTNDIERNIWWKEKDGCCIFSRGRDVGLVGLAISSTCSARSLHSRSRADKTLNDFAWFGMLPLLSPLVLH